MQKIDESNLDKELARLLKEYKETHHIFTSAEQMPEKEIDAIVKALGGEEE